MKGGENMNQAKFVFKEVNVPELNGHGKDLIEGFGTGFGIAMAYGTLYFAAT